MNRILYVALVFLIISSALSAAEADKIKVNYGVLSLYGEIEFIHGSDTIKNESFPVIDAIALFMKENPDVKILRIEGYCSSMTDENSNLELSKLRAMSVAKAVISRGVECRRLFASGFGSALPFSSSVIHADHITAVIAAGKFRKPVIMPVDGGGIVAGDPCK